MTSWACIRLHSIPSTTIKLINLLIKLFKTLPESTYIPYHSMKSAVSLTARVKEKSQRETQL